jgi:hypothetical protein
VPEVSGGISDICRLLPGTACPVLAGVWRTKTGQASRS